MSNQISYFGSFLGLILLNLFLTGTSHANPSCPDLSADVNAIIEQCNFYINYGPPINMGPIHYIIEEGELFIGCCNTHGCNSTLAAGPGCFQSSPEDGNTGPDASLV